MHTKVQTISYYNQRDMVRNQRIVSFFRYIQQLANSLYIFWKIHAE